MTFHAGDMLLKALLGLSLLELWINWGEFIFLTKEPYWVLSLHNRLVVGTFLSALTVEI